MHKILYFKFEINLSFKLIFSLLAGGAVPGYEDHQIIWNMLFIRYYKYVRSQGDT